MSGVGILIADPEAAPPPALPRPWVVAHRGLVESAPENSLEALEAAIEVGADFVECDVRRDLRGDLVLFHDAEIGGTPLGQLTREAAGALLGRLPPLLSEALALVRGRIGVDVEIKEPGLAAEVADLLAASRNPRPPLVTSFLEGEVRTAAERRPDLPRGLIMGGWGSGRSPGPVVEALACGATHLVLERHRARAPMLEWAASSGLSVLVWTVNRPSELRRLLRSPLVGGIVTDRARLALSLRQPE